MKEENQKALQEKYFEFSMLGQQMKQLEKQVEMVNNQIVEMTLTSQSIDDFSKINLGTELLIPLSNGIFAKAELKDNKELLLNIGSDTVVKKNIAETKDFIAQQLTDIKKAKQQLLMELQNMSIDVQSIEQELTELTKGQ